MSFWDKVKEAVVGAPMPSAERREALRKVEPEIPFAAGQVWSYKTRPVDEGSTVRVLLVGLIADRVVVHVALEGLQVQAPDGSLIAEVAHLPMAEEALRRSVRRLLASDAAIGSLEGYEQWEAAGAASMFTLSVAEMVDVLEAAMRGAGE